MPSGNPADPESPLDTTMAQANVEETKPSAAGAPDEQDWFARAQRRKLPDERKSITHKFSVGGQEGYVIVGMYPEGAPGEIFVKMAKEGSTLSGFMDGLALSVSVGLQYGVPLKALVGKLTNTRFEPSGFTENPKIPQASSVLDYIARWLDGKFLSLEYLQPRTDINQQPVARPTIVPKASSAEMRKPSSGLADALSCANCGMLMVPNGSCYKCINCGGTSGCS